MPGQIYELWPCMGGTLSRNLKCTIYFQTLDGSKSQRRITCVGAAYTFCLNACAYWVYVSWDHPIITRGCTLFGSSPLPSCSTTDFSRLRNTLCVRPTIANAKLYTGKRSLGQLGEYLCYYFGVLNVTRQLERMRLWAPKHGVLDHLLSLYKSRVVIL